MANNNWNNYTEKTATPVDADEVMARDSTDGKNKKLLFGTFWKWVAKKLNEATISELQTSNKTIVGALNQLNSDKQESLIKYIGTGPNSGKNESLPTYDFSNEDTGLYLAVASNGNAIDATNYGGLLGVVMHAKKYSSISLMTSIRMDGNNNELKFSVNGNILSSPSLSWYAEIRVYKININI